MQQLGERCPFGGRDHGGAHRQVAEHARNLWGDVMARFMPAVLQQHPLDGQGALLDVSNTTSPPILAILMHASMYGVRQPWTGNDSPERRRQFLENTDWYHTVEPEAVKNWLNTYPVDLAAEHLRKNVFGSVATTVTLEAMKMQTGDREAALQYQNLRRELYDIAIKKTGGHEPHQSTYDPACVFLRGIGSALHVLFGHWTHGVVLANYALGRHPTFDEMTGLGGAYWSEMNRVGLPTMGLDTFTWLEIHRAFASNMQSPHRSPYEVRVTCNDGKLTVKFPEHLLAPAPLQDRWNAQCTLHRRPHSDYPGNGVVGACPGFANRIAHPMIPDRVEPPVTFIRELVQGLAEFYLKQRYVEAVSAERALRARTKRDPKRLVLRPIKE